MLIIKILDTNGLVNLNTKIATENFAERLKQADLVNKTDFRNKQTNFHRQITSNKIKHWQVQKKLNSLITKDSNFFWGRIFFASNGGC